MKWVGKAGDLVEIYIILLGSLAIVFWAYPIWFTPKMVGIMDWDFLMLKFDVLRSTVLDYGQWPGHNPWTTGGVPLLGHPSVNIFSIRSLFVLLLGTFWGLRFGSLA